MQENPLALLAPGFVDLLDATALTLDPTLCIRDASLLRLDHLATAHRWNGQHMLRDARNKLPSDLPEDLRYLAEMELESLKILVTLAGNPAPEAHMVGAMYGSPTFSGTSHSTLSQMTGSIIGITHNDRCAVGASCLHPISQRGTAGTSGYWVDNLTGLPLYEWLEHRADQLNFCTEFIGGPWHGRVLTDERICEIPVRNWSVFGDYIAQGRPVSDRQHQLRFRLSWNGSVHHHLSRAHGKAIASIEQRLHEGIVLP